MVTSVDGAAAVVRWRPLQWTGTALRLGPPASRRAVVSVGGRALATAVRPGDRVALHWDWICDVLSQPAVHALRHYTECQLRLVNEALDRPAADLVLR